jgi:hypothetical protein
MEKFQTHAGPKSVDDILSEVLRKPRQSEREVLRTRAVAPGEVPVGETVKFCPVDYEVLKAGEPDWRQETDGNFASVNNVATGPVGPSDSSPYLTPPGANGPAGPATATGMTGGWSASAEDGIAIVRDRAEVDLRKAIRRCHKEGVPLDRMVEIFRLELVDIVHDD